MVKANLSFFARQQHLSRNGRCRMAHLAAVITSVMGFSGSANAQDNRTWNGSADTDWTNAANWNTGVPDANDNVNLAGAAGGSLSNVYSGFTDQYRLFFNSSAGAYTLNGPSTVTFFDFSSNAPKIENNSAGTQTINFAVALNGTGSGGSGEINPVDGNLVFNSTVDLAGTTELKIWGNNGKTVTFNGTIGSSGNSGNNALSLNQNSTAIFAANNTYGGTTTISAGTLQVGTGGTAGSLGTGAVTNNAALVFNRSDDTTVANAISGSGTVTKQGAGILTVTANNSYTGTTTISGGTIRIGNGGTTGSLGSGGIVNNGSLNYNRTDALTIAGAISGNGSLNVTGGSLSLTSTANTFSGGTTVNGGTLSLTGGNNGNSSTGTGTLTINAGATVTAFSHNSLGQGTGAALSPLVINGGTFQADQYNHINSITMTGGSLGIRAGVTQVDGMDMKVRSAVNPTITTNAAAATATISSKLTLNAPTTFTVADGAAANDLQVTGVMVGSSSLTKGGAGLLSLTAQSTYSGNTTVNGGTLSLDGGGGASGTIRGAVTVNTGGTLRLNAGDVTGYGTSGQLSTINLAGGTMHVNVAGAGLNQTLGNAVINMTGGTITGVAGSNLDFFQTSSALNSLASATTSTVSGTSLSIRQTAGLTVTTAAGTTASGIDLDVSSVIASNASFTAAPLIKAGAGTMRVSAANTYSGATQVNGGRLLVTGTLRNSPSFTVGTGATLELGAVNIFVAGHGVALADTRTITANAGTILMNTAFDARFGNVTLNNGATLTSNRILTGYDAYLANTVSGPATVSVTGTGASTMNGSGGIHLGGTQNFSVADTTASSADDLVVTMRLDNGGLGGGTGGVNKTGAGTMLLNGQNTYTGPSTVNAGTLAVDGNQQANRLTNNHAVTVNNTGSAFEVRGVNALPTGVNSVDVTVNAGSTLRVVSGGSSAIGAGGTSHAHLRNLNLSGGTVDLAYSGGGSAYNGESFQLNGDVTVTGTTASVITSSGNTGNTGIALNGNRTFTVNDVAAGADLTISAELENTDTTPGDDGLTKAGNGTLVLSGVHSYSGPTTVSAGTLFLDSTSSISGSTTTVNSGGTLAGTGTAGPVAIASGGTLSPGASPGLLTTGSITTSSGSSVIIEINGLTAGSLYDRISTTGTVDLGNSTLVVSLNFPSVAEGDSFDIWLNNDTDAVTGTFNGLTEGASIPSGMGSFTITYQANADAGATGNDIRLTYVPEPSAAALAGLSLLALARRRRRVA